MLEQLGREVISNHARMLQGGMLSSMSVAPAVLYSDIVSLLAPSTCNYPKANHHSSPGASRIMK
jgi:hypothetical protein